LHDHGTVEWGLPLKANLGAGAKAKFAQALANDAVGLDMADPCDQYTREVSEGQGRV